jgi:hypothetical protein
VSGGVDRWRTRPRNVAIVAAGIGVVIGLVCWTRLTLYALAGVGAAAVLWFGVRKLLTERRAASGCGTECAEGHTYAYQCALKPPAIDPGEILGIDPDFHPWCAGPQVSAAELVDESAAAQRELVHGAGERLRNAAEDEAEPERCCVCGAHRVIHQVVTPAHLCGDCFLCRCGQSPCVRTGINDPAVSSEAADLTADEARTLAEDLGLQLYRAQDALAFVAECCDIADRQGRQPTTAAVREWLKGAQCARQAGLVLTPGATAPRDLGHLLGHPVTVTNPTVPVSWTGRLVGLADMPSLVLEQRGGRQVTLPQAFDVEPTTCAICKGRGKVPNWQDWDAYHGEPRPKPCPGCSPDGPGPGPDAVRTDPDAAGQQAADQPGHDPDALRTRVGTAIRSALKARTLPALVDGVGRPISGTEIGLTEYDIADVALAELTPELERLRRAERAAILLAGARRHADTTRNACLRTAERLEARAAALLNDVEDQAAFVAKAHQHDAKIWRGAAAEIRAALGAPAEGSSR